MADCSELFDSPESPRQAGNCRLDQANFKDSIHNAGDSNVVAAVAAAAAIANSALTPGQRMWPGRVDSVHRELRMMQHLVLTFRFLSKAQYHVG